MKANRAVFRCARGGLPVVLNADLLGGYDGAGSWALHLPNLRTGDEQFVVETHEGLHHEFQASTSWGLLSAMAILLSARGYRTSTLADVFDHMVEHCKRTHELFATFLSSAAVGMDKARQLLADNTEYSEYLDSATGLVVAPALPLQLRETATAAVLRACMAPQVVIELLSDGYGSLRSDRLTFQQDGPDQRLSAFVNGGGPREWTPLFDEIVADFPDRGGDQGGMDRRIIPAEAHDVERLRIFEDEILLRRYYQYTADVLAAQAMPTVAWDDQANVARLLIGTVADVDTDLASRLSLVTERRPVRDDGLEYDRQRVVLRDPLPAELVQATDTLRLVEAFHLPDTDGDAHVCALWMTAETVARHFTGATCEGRTLVALAAPARASTGEPVIRLGLLPTQTTPNALQELLGEVPLVAITMQSVLTERAIQHQLSQAEPVFVLMDLPVAWHVKDWIRHGANVSFALSPLEGLSCDIWLAVFQVDTAPTFRFLALGGRVGTSLMIDHLIRSQGNALRVDNRLLGDGTELAVRLLLSSLHLLEQDTLG